MLSDQTRYSRLANITKIINTKLELREVLQRVTMAISEEIVTRCWNLFTPGRWNI